MVRGNCGVPNCQGSSGNSRLAARQSVPAQLYPYMIVLVSHMLRQRKPSALSLSYFSCVVLLICSGLHAQENCNVEVKLLLSPAETQAAVAALSAQKEMTGRVYFFDTGALDLLSQGAIVRLEHKK